MTMVGNICRLSLFSFMLSYVWLFGWKEDMFWSGCGVEIWTVSEAER